MNDRFDNNSNKRVADYLDKIIKEDEADREVSRKFKDLIKAIKNKNGVKRIICVILIIAAMLGCIKAGKLLNGEQDSVELMQRTSVTNNYITNKNSSSNSKKSSSSSKKSKTTTKKEKESSTSSETSESDDDTPIGGNEIGNTPSNIVNGGFMSKQNEYLFYTNSNNGNNLTKRNIQNGMESTIFNKETNSINVIGKSVYAHLCNTNLKMVEISIDGKLQKELPIGCNDIMAYKNYIISADQNGVYKMNKEDGAKITIYKGKIKYATSYQGKIYLIESGDLKVIDENGLEIEDIDTNVNSYSISDEGLYYIKDNIVFNEQKGDTKIRAKSINVSDGIMYFSNMEDHNKLYTKDLKSGIINKMSDIEVDNICVCDGYVAVKKDNMVSLIK